MNILFCHIHLRMCNCELRSQWWAQVESNHRPHAYQACALTFWAMSPCYLHNYRNRLTRRSASWTYGFRSFNRWWRWRDSNPWPSACRADALPTELHPRKGLMNNYCWKAFGFSSDIIHFSSFIFLQPHSRRRMCNGQGLSWLWVPENRTTTLSFELCSSSSVLFLCELRKILFQSFLFSIERRWSSRTFRYGYLVTT